MSKGKKARNRGRDVIGDYYKTNTEYARDNRKRQKTEGKRGFSTFEKVMAAVIVFGLVGIFVRYMLMS